MPIEPSPTGDPAYSLNLPRTPESAHAARHLVSSALDVWGLGDFEDAAWLVVTELMANAAMHAHLDLVRVTVTCRGPRRVRIAVVDRSRRMPERHKAADGDEHGRGLAIVEALSLAWDVDRLPWGKRVWADLGDAEVTL
ncbi:ATP-binding protein [Streptomyces sp. NPDC001552]|uniref:ATP-binding protein n=1 Tax=Streptomyces sp. NPDC001552 TaxID=3364587 RepID=UPI00368B67A8